MELATMADTLTLTQHLTTTLQLSSTVFPIDSIAPPPVRSKSTCRPRRALLKRRRTRRLSPPHDDGDSSGSFLSFLFSGGDDGGFNGGGGGGNGGGGNFDRFNWHNNDDNNDEFSSYSDDPAFDFVYEVVCWIVFSNCLHFAFKKVLRLASEAREKVSVSDPMRIVSVC